VPAAAAERPGGRSRLAFGVAAALAGATLGAGLALWPSLRGERPPSTGDRPVRFQIPPPDGSLFNFSGRDAGPVAFSPDGRTLVFAATDPAGKKQLFVRRLDRLAAEPLAGTEGGSYPFWSPDSRHLGFFADGKLKRIEATGGAVQVLCDAPLGRGGTWNEAGEILFSPRAESPLFRVSAAGGPISQITTIDSGLPVTSHRWPSFLPDGRRFLYIAFSTVLSGPDSGHALYVGSLDRPEQHLLLRTNAKAEYVAPGFLLFTRERNLLAARFDPRSLALRGEPVVIAERVKVYPNTASALFSASQRGGVVFASGESPPISQLVWFDRAGAQLETAGDPVDCEDPRLSPDGRRIAANRIDPQSGASNIWIFGGAPASWSRLTFTPTFEHAAIWSPDGERIAFDSFRNPPADIYVKSTAGAGETLLVEGDDAAVPTDWSSDGRLLLFQRLQAKTGWDLWTASPGGEQPPAPVLATPSNEEGGQFSPDGRWLAYASDESGRAEIYVVAFPGLSGKWQISAAGGTQPRWRRDGRELFYLGADRALMAVAVEPGPAFVAATPTRLFHTRARYTGYRAYDVSLDGRRFLINTVLAEGESPPLTVALDSLPAANR
jgi:eukaryotic-like serine/threonine-protein kinase